MFGRSLLRPPLGRCPFPSRSLFSQLRSGPRGAIAGNELPCAGQRARSFHTTRLYCRQAESSAQQADRLKKSGPVSWASLAVFLAAGAGMVYYFKEEKRRVKEAITHAAKPIGRPRIGGPFTLIDSATGKTVTDKDFQGKWMLLYFGFTWCPDVCPEELNKVSEVITQLEATKAVGDKVVPIFISIDPERDTPEVVQAYVKEFHPRMVGLTGAKEQTDAVAKAYRVHVSKGPPLDGNPNEYIVDHSIIEYLVDPQGVFTAFYGQNMNADEMGEDITKYVRNWKPQDREKELAELEKDKP